MPLPLSAALYLHPPYRLPVKPTPPGLVVYPTFTATSRSSPPLLRTTCAAVLGSDRPNGYDHARNLPPVLPSVRPLISVLFTRRHLTISGRVPVSLSHGKPASQPSGILDEQRINRRPWDAAPASQDTKGTVSRSTPCHPRPTLSIPMMSIAAVCLFTFHHLHPRPYASREPAVLRQVNPLVSLFGPGSPPNDRRRRHRTDTNAPISDRRRPRAQIDFHPPMSDGAYGVRPS